MVDDISKKEQKQTKNVFKFIKQIEKDSHKEESYGTGLVGEQLIISGYKTMTIDKLEKLRFILNKIIKKKKEMKRVYECKKLTNNK